MITKAVFPVAGLGSRFLPATKASPKEMMPIADKPLIQHAVEEAIDAGITDLIFITSYSKRAIEDHFDKNTELESHLEQKQEFELLKLVKNILPDGINCVYVRQPYLGGLGHSILCAEKLINKEPFAVLLADDLIAKKYGCLKLMCDKYHETKSSIIAVEEVAKEDVEKYGVIETFGTTKNLSEIKSIVEKPKLQDAPSNLAVVGRYIFTPEIFEKLKQIPTVKGQELQITDAIAALIEDQKVYGCKIPGIRYDCGQKLGYLKAIVAFGLEHPTIGKDFSKYLSELNLHIDSKAIAYS